jgi:hypothetical protein
MKRREFIKTTAAGGAFAIVGPSLVSAMGSAAGEPWFSRSMRWAQLTLVENDPGQFDPDFWLSYFKKIHADAACLSAGGIVAYYPTEVPLHYRSAWLGNSDPFGYLVEGCRKMNMSVIGRTDPHAARQDVYDRHPGWIAVTENGQKRRHWANPELWVTCCLGNYNFDFMTRVHDEIMERYQLDGIFANRWAGSGICYCESCKENFRAFSGLDIPVTTSRLDSAYNKYMEWRNKQLKDIWLLWDGVIIKRRSTSRFIPNGYPDKVVTGKLSDIVFTDYQARSGATLPWSNGKVAKELRASIGMKPLGGIFSVGLEERYRWKDSVQTEAETRIWVAEGTANGMRPWFTKFSGTLYDRRWLDIVDKIYQVHYRNERYLRNIYPMARVGVVFSEQIINYGGEQWQQRYGDHGLGMYHALIEERIPFEMVNDQLLEAENLRPFKLLILPNVATLSGRQCDQLRQFSVNGGSLLATYETSLYDEEGNRRDNFGLAGLLGVSYDNGVEGPMQNSYLRLKSDQVSGRFHPVLEGLEDAYRIINSINRVKVTPDAAFPDPVTLIPTYPDLPMEDVFPRVADSGIRELYLRESGKGRVAYFPGDIDRTFWQIMSPDQGKLLRNTIRWALDEEQVVDVQGPGVIDVTVWRQDNSMTVHLVNLTNPMMMKGPFREFIPVDARVTIKIPPGAALSGVHLLVSGQKADYQAEKNTLTLMVRQIQDWEIIGVDLK